MSGIYGGYISFFKGLSTLDRVQAGLSALIKLSLVAAFTIAVVEADWTTAFVSAAAFAATLLPWYLARSYHLRVPVGFEFIVVLFIYATLFLGEVHGFYTRFWWWDMALHAGAGMAFGFIGFLILYSFYRDGRFQAPSSLIAVLSFSAALAIGAIWEIFEFAMDVLFGLNMQRSSLLDTMRDLIVDTIGACVAAVSGYVYLRYRSRGLGVFRYYLHSYFKADALE
jgi:hypothetical protein